MAPRRRGLRRRPARSDPINFSILRTDRRSDRIIIVFLLLAR